MLETIVLFAVCALLIVVAAHFLCHACDDIAEITGWGHFFVGTIFLAISTSAPEFFVDIDATMQGLPNLAAGDLIGSSLMNLCILSVCVLLFRPEKKRPMTLDEAWQSGLAAGLTAMVALLIGAQLPGVFLGIHWGTMLLALMYVFGVRMIFQLTRTHGAAVERTEPMDRKRMAKPFMRFLVAALVIFLSAPVLVTSAETIARVSGLGQNFIGATLLALTTSLPELAASVAAMRIKAFSLVLGNIVGSNTFNMTIFVFMDWVSRDGAIWSMLDRVYVVPAVIVTCNMLLLVWIWRLRHAHRAVRSWGTVGVLLLSLSGFAALYYLR